MERSLNDFLLESQHTEVCLQAWVSVGILYLNAQKINWERPPPTERVRHNYDTQGYLWEHDFVPSGVSPDLLSGLRPLESHLSSMKIGNFLHKNFSVLYSIARERCFVTLSRNVL